MCYFSKRYARVDPAVYDAAADAAAQYSPVPPRFVYSYLVNNNNNNMCCREQIVYPLVPVCFSLSLFLFVGCDREIL